jgi:hypothetical protein
MAIIKIKRGLKSQLPVSGLNAGEPLVCTDTGEAYMSTGADSKVTLVPDIASLATITIADSDLIPMQDVSETTGQLVKKTTFAAFKTALNIPAGSTDEKVAAYSGATAGYLTDILAVGAGMSKTNGANIITITITEVDGGAFV